MKVGLDNTARAAGPEAETAGARIILERGLLAIIHRYVTRFHRAHGQGLETGGMLTGRFAQESSRPVFRITGFIGAGPNADCSTESVLFDTEYQSRALTAMRLQNPEIANLGCIHVHPGRMDTCSEEDWLADIEAVRASDTKALVFAIITLNNPCRDELSRFYRNFKFDFFVLSEQAGFEYQHIRPTVEDGVVLPKSKRLTLGHMNHRLERDGDGLSPWVAVELDACGDEPSPPLSQCPVGQVRPSAEVLLGSGSSATPQHSRHCAWRSRLLKDKRRLVAEVRAMEERYGGRAALRLKGNLLYWEYTVVESGRHFPIEVRYPRRYPFEPPHIISLLPLPGSPHQMPGNELCWTNRLGASEWNPARDTAATCIHAAHRWFACLLVYLTLGKWPAEADEELRRLA